MDNNKNRMKDRPKSNAELRKMYSEHGADIGIENGQKIGARDCGTNKIKKIVSIFSWYDFLYVDFII